VGIILDSSNNANRLDYEEMIPFLA